MCKIARVVRMLYESALGGVGKCFLVNEIILSYKIVNISALANLSLVKKMAYRIA